ncbi:MAG: DUF502 domain-containing protein [Planctomycetales bacterium]|nr:DUF502 domain-containing protein [bacterium]UNM06955.1 MAG: DUF502 domain-containing protein [Planctomycetales bacterium]
MFKRFLGTVIAGILYFLPLAATIWAVGLVYNWSAGVLGSRSRFYNALGGEDVGIRVYLIYLAILCISILIFWLIGRIGGSIASQRIRSYFERLMRRVPVLNTVYSSTDQLAELFRGRELDDPSLMRSTVLVRIDNCYMLGLMVNSESFDLHGVPHRIVYIPSAPLPTSGTNYLAPVHDIHDVNLTVDELTSITMSLGGSGAAIFRSKDPLVLDGQPPDQS